VGDDKTVPHFRFFLLQSPLVNYINLQKIKKKTHSTNITYYVGARAILLFNLDCLEG